MPSGITMRELNLDDCGPKLLALFDRYQEVPRCWRKKDGQWVLQELPYVVQWNEEKKQTLTDFLKSTIEGGGSVAGAFGEGQLIGFASVRAKPFGSAGQYINLDMLHVSNSYRGQGIGKQLFLEMCEKAKQLGAAKLYISAHSAEDSIKFYRGIGCVDALEINQALQENEPFDCQLEYELYPE